MLDLAFVRANLELVVSKLLDRGQDTANLLVHYHSLDIQRRARITEAEQLKAQRNKLSEEVARLKKSGQDAAAVIEMTRMSKARMEWLEAAAAEAEAKMQAILARIPNLPLADVPVGKSEQENVEIKRWGEQPKFNFAAKPHWELGEQLGILDFERAAKLSGARFAVYWAQGARMERALINFMLDMHTREHGYMEVLPPFMVNSKSLFGTGQLPKFAEDLFRCVDEQGYEPGTYRENDHWLIPTAEVPVTNLYRDETLDDADLTQSLVAYTPCFRSEAGSYGKDVRGIIRQHQFQKVELVKFTRPEDSEAEHEKLTGNAEAVLERLELPYRRVLLCTGDMGFSSAKTYDLEVWLPGQNLYREISSCSNFWDFQARRANIRYRPKGQNKSALVHTLNGSGLAVGRTWLAIVENYQQADGTVRVPEALIPYMDGLTVIEPRSRTR
ncbi:MAG TPA: serine--tRNA ligase [Acidobacteriaceae bacterium]|nr:serine--tRNA ligase [Acidobacteriaceae bacterium]